MTLVFRCLFSVYNCRINFISKLIILFQEEDEAGNNSDSSRSSVYLPEELYNETVDNPHYNSRPKKRVTFGVSLSFSIA